MKMVQGSLRLLRQEDGVDARKNSSSSDGDPRHELVDLTVRMEQMRWKVEIEKFLTSSSLRMASMMCLGVTRPFLPCLAMSPASSNTSAVRYSSTAAR